MGVYIDQKAFNYKSKEKNKIDSDDMERYKDGKRRAFIYFGDTKTGLDQILE